MECCIRLRSSQLAIWERSGLDAVMGSAYKRMSTIFHLCEDIPDLRMAAYILVITEVADA